MSQENVELVRRLYDEWAQGRLSAHLHLFDQDVEYARPSAGGKAAGLPGTWHGREAMSKAIREFLEPFADVRVAAERCMDVGDSVVVLTRFTATTKASGMPITMDAADVLTLRNSRIVRFAQYLQREEALEAVGLRE